MWEFLISHATPVLAILLVFYSADIWRISIKIFLPPLSEFVHKIEQNCECSYHLVIRICVSSSSYIFQIMGTQNACQKMGLTGPSLTPPSF